MYRLIALAASLIALPAAAGELRDIQGGSVDLGSYQGIVYYTQDGPDLRVVATLAADQATPIRLVATLAANQHLLISVPGKAGEPERSLEIVRSADKLLLETPDAGADMAATVSQ
jgi:hypothetical protein